MKACARGGGGRGCRMQDAYQRYLTPEFEPFDPLELAKETKGIVTRVGEEGLERKYAGIY